MPRPPRPLMPGNPRDDFIAALRQMRASAPARVFPGSNRPARPWSLEDVARAFGISDKTLEAALSGRRLPSVKTLRAMVIAWSPNGDDDRIEWLERLAAISTVSEPVIEMSEEDAAYLRELDGELEEAKKSFNDRTGQLRMKSDGTIVEYSPDQPARSVVYIKPAGEPSSASSREESVYESQSSGLDAEALAELHKRLRELHTRSGISVRRLAQRTPVSQQTISDIFAGRSHRPRSKGIIDALLKEMGASEPEWKEIEELRRKAAGEN